MWCLISHLHSHVAPCQSHAWTCGALSVIFTCVTCTLLPLVLNPDLLCTVPAVLASLFANQETGFMMDLLLPLPSAFAFCLCLLPLISAFACCLCLLPLTTSLQSLQAHFQIKLCCMNDPLSIPGSIAAGPVAFPYGTLCLFLGHSLPFHRALSAFLWESLLFHRLLSAFP